MSDTSPEIHVDEQLLDRVFGPEEPSVSAEDIIVPASISQRRTLVDAVRHAEWFARVNSDPQDVPFSGGGIND